MRTYEKHGGYKSPEYRSWQKMKLRCYNPNDTYYNHYGGRGITVCERWRHSFGSFIKDMGKHLSSKNTIDRIDNDGNYEPSNCRWATRSEQQYNTRKNHIISFRGKTQCLAAWTKELGMPRGVLWARLKRYNWTIEKALLTPVKPY